MQHSPCAASQGIALSDTLYDHTQGVTRMQQQQSQPLYAQPLVITRAQRAIRTAAQRDACNELLQAWHALQVATRRHQDTSLQRARFNAAMDAVLPFVN